MQALEPMPTRLDPADHSLMYAERGGYLGLCSRRGLDQFCLFSCQLYATAKVRCLSSARPYVAPLCNHVVHIVGVRAKEQMARSYAKRIVATMKDADAFWRCRPCRNVPRDAVCKNILTEKHTVPEIAIAFGIYRTGPFPAPVSFFDLCPEKTFRLLSGETLHGRIL